MDMPRQVHYETTLSKSVNILDRFYLFICGFGVLVLCLTIVLPLLHVVAASLSDPRMISLGKVFIWPIGLRFTGYTRIMQMPQVWRGYGNSMIYVVMGVVVSITMIILTAYPLSRREFRARRLITILLTITMLFGGGIIPLYIVVMKLGMLNTRWAIVLPGCVSAFSVFMMRNYIKANIPEDMYEAAVIDGSSHTWYLLKVIVPLSIPIMAVFVLWIAVGMWNSYFGALMFLSDNKKSPLQLVLVGLLIYFNYGNAALMDPLLYITKKEMAYLLQYSLIIISSLPMLMLYPFIQKYFIKGIMIGAIKG
jgi:putative aldouronate transport system permease protein